MFRLILILLAVQADTGIAPTFAFEDYGPTELTFVVGGREVMRISSDGTFEIMSSDATDEETLAMLTEALTKTIDSVLGWQAKAETLEKQLQECRKGQE